MTNREAIAQVRNGLNSVRGDDRLPNRLIYYSLVNYSDILIKRDSDNRKIFSNLSQLGIFDCFDMEDVDLKSCYPILLGKCRGMKKSIKKLPEPFTSSINMPLLYVSSVDDSRSFYYSNPYLYSKRLDAEFVGNEKYWWLENGYLYIPDEDIESIKVRGFFKGPNINTGKCTPFLDNIFNVPSYLLADIIRLTSDELAKYAKRMPADENTNANNNIKT